MQSEEEKAVQNCLQNCREIVALLEAMTPEERAELDERFSTLFKFIGELLVRAVEGHISREEFDMWMEAVAREAGVQ
jgi:hypothetical protein